MLTQDNLADLLKTLGFEKKGEVYRKQFGAAILAVNFIKHEIIYPEAAGLIINERQTCNFDANENFVVLECVHRLLEKGYKPEHIELEPKWKLGRGASGGRADILIKDNDSRPLLIIECKTAGTEFKRAWNKTLQDGDQLFSYAQQISETQFLCLYTADLEEHLLGYTSHIIAHRDNEKYLVDNPLFKSFKSVTDVKERHAVWRDTYKLDYTTKGIFEENIQAYHIGKDKYSLADLYAISASDQQKKYHEFATILRQHNVSGRENAFDKLVNLFLCKLVDEIENPSDLKFYWKGVAYDTHFDLMDRLQQLYQAGMGKFLGEDITYINQGDVNNALRFIKQNPDATQRAVWNLFIQQKFFTNNDFSLIDVHNEKLFYQNSEVLLKILQMWQDIRLTNPDGHNQFLGDMFEGFLDQGVKQSEGQFFTPMPICRFIIMSLPLASFVQRSATPPKAIDYACGAGHFLTELALQLKPLVRTHQSKADLAAYHKALYGIEKEYRLSKVAKVSAFMYGQQGINICYGDGLINHHEAFPGINDGSFDLLVANPPYSVRGFLETLPEEERKAYALTETINDLETSSSIETFFIERAKQLLRADGVAAIILPSSILSNGGSTYIRTREILIQYFDIVAIAEFRSGTFGKTGTNTVTLFLRRKKTDPDSAAHYRERVEEWFKGCHASKRKQVIYKDEHLIARYAAHINVPLDDYKTLLKGNPNGAWNAHLEEIYLEKFNGSTEVANLHKARWFKALSSEEQNSEFDKRYLAFVQSIECDKLFHFVMACEQPNPVLIIRSPTESKSIKKFLGYEWSSAKGDEGIKLIKDAHGRHLTPLYDETNRDNAEKLNYSIAENFNGTLTVIPAALQDVARTAPLVDMLDFSRAVFEKQINLAIKGGVVSKWPIFPLSRVAEIRKGTSITQKKASPGRYKVIAGGMTHAYMHNAFNRPANIITVSGSGASAGYVAFWKEPIFASDCITVRGVNDEHTEYLYHVLKIRQGEIQAASSGAAQPHVYTKDLEPLPIPQPDPVTLKNIVSECGSVDDEVNSACDTVEKAFARIESEVANIYGSPAAHSEIDKLAIDIQYGLNEAMNEGGVGYKIFRMNEIIRGRMVDNGSMKCADISAEEFAKYKLSKGNLLFIRSNGSLEHIGKVGLFDLDGDYCYASYLVRIVPDSSRVLPRYLCCIMNSAVFRKGMVSLVVKSGGTNNINATKMKNIKVPVLSLAEQKKFVAKIDKLEEFIAEAQAVIDGATARKQAILQKYL
ncbi:N-6 DNA methylase [Acetobacter syzygii]|uniref:site-specific DNA-methyltransferase (adenine-specific) n=1 Tax=Acetobacter syzygii TaxID=146476 RepID=A0A270B5K0_9PROT|nr:N-6 DNA methylase [Acetobacter syzygii]NSL92787.1 N-6 DNA methylase [Acetobacter syzygii]PAL20050.1 restriction endonuclease [Acetobacter syzygii]PAL21902.1 restriction endonuclease [Acetobacter syzygii]